MDDETKTGGAGPDDLLKRPSEATDDTEGQRMKTFAIGSEDARRTMGIPDDDSAGPDGVAKKS